ncbi:MAG: M23 family metallopeptidase [Bacteroidia bacterium]|nr:M23 family metallopeptidase [Bacteroidia bacterium]
MALSAQKPVTFVWPLDSPRVLTANYGELRPNHFHAGLDFSTGGQVDQPVYAAAEGYVSRIKVSATGYGKCVYITHPNGKVTLYGHLNSYGLKIGDIVKKEQYAQQSFEVEIFPKPNTVFVRKGEIIGLSGSTGSSTGPHLHFEVRDEKTEAPYNPLEYYKLDDVTKPMIQSIAFYNLSDTLVPKLHKTVRINPNEDDVLLSDYSLFTLDQSIIGIGFSGIDRFTPTGSPNNIYMVKLYYDGRLIYSHKLSGIKFDDTRYINEYSETQGNFKYQKCFLSTVYPKEFITKAVNKGRIVINDTNFHMLKLVVNDETGNQNDVQLFIRSNKLSKYTAPSIKSDVFVNCTKNFSIKKDKMFIQIPANTLFYSTPLIVENTIETTGKLIVLPSDANLKSAVTLGFKVPSQYAKEKQKLVLKNGSAFYTPLIKKDSVYFAVKSLGWFQLSLDNQAPKVSAAFKTKKGKKASVGNTVSFIISDSQSGIGKYKLFINNQWVLAEYDAKSDLLVCHFDEESPTGHLSLRLEVEDKVGNKTKTEYSVRR